MNLYAYLVLCNPDPDREHNLTQIMLEAAAVLSEALSLESNAVELARVNASAERYP